MALSRPDYKYQNGKKHLEELDGEKGDLIRYYVQEKDKHTEALLKQIEEMREVFNGIRKFTR